MHRDMRNAVPSAAAKPRTQTTRRRVLIDVFRVRSQRLLDTLLFSHLVRPDPRSRAIMPFEFLSTVGHDLKSPLGVIQSLADVLLDGDAGPLSAEQTALVRRIHASARHGLTLSNNLLSAERIQAGDLSLQRSTQSLLPIVEKALAFARSAADLKNITLRLSSAADLPLVPIDRVQFERVVFNLLDNAIKYTPEGGVVEVALHGLAHHVALVVRDNGAGIAADQLPSLFQKYQGRPLNSTVEGSGLGLFIVRAIVDAHGGRVAVESAVSRGTTVTVFVPLHALAPVVDPDPFPAHAWTSVNTPAEVGS